MLVEAALAWCIATPATVPAPPPANPRLEIDLTWSAPGDCPDQEGIVSAIGELVGGRLRLDPDAPLHVDGVIERTKDAFVLDVSIVGGGSNDTRQLRAERCDDVAAAAAIVIAASVLEVAESLPPDTPQSIEVPEPEVPPAPPPEPIPQPRHQPSPQAAPVEEPTKRPTHGPRIRAQAFMAGGLRAGTLPNVLGAVRGDLSLLFDNGRVSASFGHAFGPRPNTDPGVQTGLTQLGVLGCYVPQRGRLEFPLCTGLHSGLATGRGVGAVSSARTRRQPWLALPVEAALAWTPRAWLALQVTAAASFGLLLPSFHLEGPSGRFAQVRMRPFGFEAFAGPAFRFP